jgi:trans-aconitate methyltransferase
MREARQVEWDAAAYHRLANPHVTWGQRVLTALPLRGDEYVLDAGCGSGRLTAELLERLPDGRVLAVDISLNMLRQAQTHLEPRFGPRVSFRQADLQELAVEEPVDAIFSTAALHWVLDHPRMFEHFFAALKPGGWLVAQCGGGPNIAGILARFDAIADEARYAPYFAGWGGPWEFASAELTAERLADAGFVDIETGLEESLVEMPNQREYRDYLENVILGSHLARLPDAELRNDLLDRLTAQGVADDPPLVFDYWRLNLKARKSI